MWKYESSDHQNISLHDNVVDDIIIENDDILLIFSEGFAIVKTHPLNDTQKSKHTTKSQIALKSAKFVSGEVNYTIRQRGTNDIHVNRPFDFSKLISGFKCFEVLQFEVKGEIFSLDGLLTSAATNQDEFAEIIFSCSDIRFCWNDYSSDAWFENWPQRI